MWNRWTRHWTNTNRGRNHARTPPPKGREEEEQECAAKDKDANHTSSPKAMTTSRSSKSSSKMVNKKKESPTKTRTGNALAQFMILSGLTVVAYQFLLTRLVSSSPEQDSLAIHPAAPTSPSPWTDAALDNHRANRANDDDVYTTTEFSCFMACVGLFGLMQRKKNRSQEAEQDALVEAAAHRRMLEKIQTRKKKHDNDSGCGNGSVSSMACEASTNHPLMKASGAPSRDMVVAMICDLQVELFTFLSAEDLITCSAVNKSWQIVVGDGSEKLWRAIFTRDFKENGARFQGLLPRICFRQYYFLHRVSRAVEIARWLEKTQQRKCVVIEGKVFDVTDFLESHPGGYHVIGDVLGTDASILWDQFQHSAEAKEMMKEFIVEDELLETQAKTIQGSSHQQNHHSHHSHPRTLAIVEKRWQQLHWCLAHAHLFGDLSDPFLDLCFKFVVWRTTKSRPKSLRIG